MEEGILRKKLNVLDKDELILLPLDVSNMRKENLEWLSLKLEGTGEEEKYRFNKSLH